MNISVFAQRTALIVILFSLVSIQCNAEKPPDPPSPTAYTLTLADVEFDVPTGMIMNYINTTEKDIFIPDSLADVPVIAIRDYCFYSKALTAVVLPSGLMDIGSRAFSSNDLHYVFIPNEVVKIGSEAFDFNSLDSVKFEENSYIRFIWREAFGGQKTTSTMTSFALPSNANPTFKGYRGGDLSTMGRDTLYVVGEEIKSFENTYMSICPYTITEADVDFDAATGTISNYDHDYEYDIVVPDNFGGTAIKVIGDNTFRMEDIMTVELSEGLEIIEYDAFDATELTEVVIPASVKKIEHDAFTGMTFSLKSVTFEANSQIRIIEQNAFDFSGELSSLSLPGHGDATFTEYRTHLGERFEPGAVISDASLYYYAVCPYELTANDVVFDQETGALTRITNRMERAVIIPDNFNGVEVIALGDFISWTAPDAVNSYGAHLISISIPGSVRDIAENAFKDNHLFSVIYNSDSYFKKVEENAFINNPGLTSITFPQNLNQDFIEYRDGDGNVFEAGNIFNNFALPHYAIVPYVIKPEDVNNHNIYGDPMRSIFDYLNTEEYCIIIPDILEGLPVEYIGKAAFITAGGAALVWVKLPSTLEYIDEGAFRDNELTEITIPGSVLEIGWYAFGGNKLISVTVEEGVTSLGNSSFSNNNIKTVSLPSTIRTLGSDVFYKNELVSIDLPEGLEEIGAEAFRYNLLESVTLPPTITYIGENAFADNPSLTNIDLPANVVKEGYTFLGWQDGNGTTVTQITDFSTYYKAQFNKTGYTLSGMVPNYIGMIELVISGDVNEVIKVSGSYSIDLNSGRNIVITPHRENYVFTPKSISITDIQADMTGQDFEADFVQAVENNSTNDFFMVYPNPATELLYINSESNTEISVFSLGGMKVMESSINMGVNSLDIQVLIPGIYIIRMEGDREARAIKFVKQ